MGKKRRIFTTNKFKAKHSAHPRSRLGTAIMATSPVNTSETIEEEIKVVPPAPEPIAAPIPTLTAEVVETKAATPKIPKAKKKTIRKKTVTSTRKRSTKKKTTTATA